MQDIVEVWLLVKESMSMNEKIRALREAKKMTQREVAKAAGMSTSAYGMIEQGRREPGRENLKGWLTCKHTTTDYLRQNRIVDNIVTKADLERLLDRATTRNGLNGLN